MVILNRLHRETVLPQPGGGFFKETELRGFVLIVHCEVLPVSKKISRSILKCFGRVMDWAETPFLTSGNEKRRRFLAGQSQQNDTQKFVIFFPRD